MTLYVEKDHMIKSTSLQLNVNEFVLTKLDPECGLAQPQLVVMLSSANTIIEITLCERRWSLRVKYYLLIASHVM